MQGELISVKEHPRFILHRSNYIDASEKSPILNKRSAIQSPRDSEFELPGFEY